MRWMRWKWSSSPACSTKWTFLSPSAARGKPLVSIRPLTAAKALLYKELRDQNVTIRQLAQKLKCKYPVAHRLLDVSRKTQVNEIAKAFRALGKQVIIGVEEKGL